MCGIAGVLHFDPARAVDVALLERSTDALAHRGPDGRGLHVDGPLGLGHRRLSIIDLSADGAQPMSNEDGTVWTVLNGELYNFLELRRELEAKGHRFRSRTDTEVLVHLYEELGDALVERLRGMFAFAVWDARRRRLLLARDRFGEKPLVYRLDRDGLAFGSEVKALLADPSVPRRPDPLAISEYLALGYVPGQRTAFEGISRLAPGHTLAVEADGRHRLRRYWRLPEPEPARALPDAAEAARAASGLRDALDEAVRLRLVADVPLGAFLSGGLDSSSVVASMAVVAPGGAAGVRTFSVGFDQASHDETVHAARVAAHLGTRHEELRVHDGEALLDLERVAWHHGEPFADASCLPTFAVSRLARRRVTVVLSGDGGDELLVGYGRHRAAAADALVRRAPRAVWAPLRSRRVRALAKLLDPTGRAGPGLARAAAYLERPLDDLWLRRVEVCSPELLAALLTDEARAALRGHDPRGPVARLLDVAPGAPWAARCAHADALSYLPDDVLTKVDIASMAHGLEARAPLLDHVLAEQVARLPLGLKLRGRTTKAVLRDAVRSRLPASTLARPKMGFAAPAGAWLRGDLRPALEEALLSPRATARGLLRPETTRRLVAEHVAGTHDHQAPLFALLMLETWHRQWIDPPPGASLGRPA